MLNSEKWVVMNQDKSTVMKKPGLNTPWYGNRKLAEDTARLARGVAVPLLEAMQLVMKHPANQPKDSRPESRRRGR